MGINVELPDTVQAEGLIIRTLKLTTNDDPSNSLRKRYLGSAGSAVYLIRPDQHVVARWPKFDASRIAAAVKTAIGKG